MNTSPDPLSRLLRFVLRLVLAMAATVFLISLMLASLVVVLGVSVWSLLTGRKPAPVVLFQQFRQARERYAQGMFRQGAGGADVVDVQATEVHERGAPAPAPADGPVGRLMR
jgi:hypothetical protein